MGFGPNRPYLVICVPGAPTRTTLLYDNDTMKILILGGNVFLGRSITEAAVGRGHEVTTFTRGKSGSSPTGAISLHGDRSKPDGMEVLGVAEWDVVIDVSRSPLQVQAAIDALGGRSSYYVFVSTTSVYADLTSGPLTPQSPVVEPASDMHEDVDSRYPNLKVRCEQIVRNCYPDGHLVVRPGLIVGPGDLTNRFTYWVERATKPGPILAPGRPERRVRFTDVRDLASWIILAIEIGVGGTFNAVGPAGRVSMAELLDACLAVTGNRQEQVHWVPDEFLLGHGVEPYTELPLWVPELLELRMFAEADSSPAEQHGLIFRPIDETITSTLRWATDNIKRVRQNGLPVEREAQLLRRWFESGTASTNK